MRHHSNTETDICIIYLIALLCPAECSRSAKDPLRISDRLSVLLKCNSAAVVSRLESVSPLWLLQPGFKVVILKCCLFTDHFNDGSEQLNT